MKKKNRHGKFAHTTGVLNEVANHVEVKLQNTQHRIPNFTQTATTYVVDLPPKIGRMFTECHHVGQTSIATYTASCLTGICADRMAVRLALLLVLRKDMRQHAAYRQYAMMGGCRHCCKYKVEQRL